MPKKLAVLGTSLTLAAALVMPLSASAAAALTQAQIDSVVSLLRAFDVDESTVVSINDSLGGKALTTTSSSCVDLTYNMTLGSTGSDVTNLQNYLIDGGYLASGYNTGYYGYLTASAAGKMQIALGIVTSASDSAYGIVGPVTREAIACGTTLSSSASIDSKSLTTTSSHPLITGTATNVKTIGLSISKGGDKFDGTGTFSVVNGRWSVTLNNEVYTPGTYGIKVYDGNNNFLNSYTLTVSSTSTKSPTCTLDVTTSEGVIKTGLTGTGYYDGSGSTYVEIHEGGWVKVKWHSTYADYATSPGGDKDLADSYETYYPGGDKAYEWTFYGGGGQTTCGVMVEIIPAKTMSCSITASKSSVYPTDQFKLTWDTTGIGDPVMYQNVKAGGYVSVDASDSMYWTAESNWGTSAYYDVFEIGWGGFSASTFNSLCSVPVKILPSS